MSVKLKKFEETFAKRFGANTLRRADEIVPYEVISTGSLALDYAMGVGGWVEGRISEIYGQDDQGKSTLAMLGIAEAQRKYPKKTCGWIEMEGKLDLPWMDSHGVDRSRCYIYYPNSAEDVADAMKDMVTSGEFSMVTLDSVGSMIPKAEQEKAADEATVGIVAKLVTRMVQVNSVYARQNGTCLLLINQVRANIEKYGPSTTTPGGWALKFGSTMKVHLRSGGEALKIGSGENAETVGARIAAKVERNKVAPKNRVAAITLITQATERYGEVGIDKADEAATLGTKLGVVDQAGPYYTLPVTGEQVQGRDKLVEALRGAPEIIEHIRQAAIESRASEAVTGPDAEVSETEMVAEAVEVGGKKRKFRGTAALKEQAGG